MGLGKGRGQRAGEWARTRGGERGRRHTGIQLNKNTDVIDGPDFRGNDRAQQDAAPANVTPGFAPKSLA